MRGSLREDGWLGRGLCCVCVCGCACVGVGVGVRARLEFSLQLRQVGAFQDIEHVKLNKISFVYIFQYTRTCVQTAA